MKLFQRKQSRLEKSITSQLSAWLSNRPCNFLGSNPAISECEALDSEEVVGRLMRSYSSAGTKRPESDSMWNFIGSKHHEPLHDSLISGDVQRVKEILRNPRQSNIMYGFDTTCQEFDSRQRKSMQNMCDHIQDYLVSLCESLGVITRFNPETLAADPLGYLKKRSACDCLNADDIIDLLEKELGVELSFKEVFPGEIGLKSSKGTIPHRAVMALYLAIRLQNVIDCFLSDKKDVSVCELGAGTGRSAYFAKQLGITNYSIVDIPITSIISGFFLVASCGADGVVLPGESVSRADQIKLMHPEGFLGANEKYDVIVSMDSFTEFGCKTAESYVQKILGNSRSFFSINHEMNEVVVGEQMASCGWKKMFRSPCWIRRGYVEELWVRS